MVPSTFVSQPVRELSEVPRNTHHSWIIWKRDPASLVTRNGTESVVKSLPAQRSLGTNELMGEFQGFRDFFQPLNLPKILDKREAVITHSLSVIWYWGQQNTPPTTKGNYRPIFHLYTAGKGVVKALAKQAQHHLRSGRLPPGTGELYSQNAGWFATREAICAIYHTN